MFDLGPVGPFYDPTGLAAEAPLRRRARKPMFTKAAAEGIVKELHRTATINMNNTLTALDEELRTGKLREISPLGEVADPSGLGTTITAPLSYLFFLNEVDDEFLEREFCRDIKYSIRQELFLMHAHRIAKEELLDPAVDDYMIDYSKVQQVSGYFLYYARMQNPLILPICNDISATQSNPTARTVDATWRLLNYLSSHPDHSTCYTDFEMILKVHSDASYHSRPGAISIAGGWHYLGNTNDDTINGTLHSISCRIPTVCGSVAEAEYAALYINGTAAA